MQVLWGYSCHMKREDLRMEHFCRAPRLLFQLQWRLEIVSSESCLILAQGAVWQLKMETPLRNWKYVIIQAL